MKIRKKLIFIILFTMLISSFLVLLNEGKKKDVKVYNFSVIIRGKNSEGWRIIKEGMEQAASEMNVNIRFLTLLEENSIDEQTELIERELSNGTDAILISPTDYKAMANTIENIRKKIPVVLFESNIETKQNIPYVSCDNYKLGQSLAEEVVRNGNTRSRVSIIKSDLSCSSINERYLGFVDEINKSKNTYELLELPKDEVQLYNKVREIIENNETDVIVTFEPSILESVGKAKKYVSNSDLKSSVELYGTGSTSLIISLIEENIINSIAMQNEFNVGYLSVKASVSQIEEKAIDDSVITSTIINNRNMYSKENQRMLFPFVR
ncbi:geranylgeranylglyceryl/heptaprenylglyceryl phosphate synthase [Clostridium sp. D46t1_190503_E9]|uniref:geranylgeranylglyceryl/heptaprenylglyceryl phosphate synthase n=1 Tax=Clostridium sp. D46t1_190503_E9 TaxID=2787137 RepID=UPI001899EFA8